MKHKVRLTIGALLLIAALSLAIIIEQNPFSTHADTTCGSSTAIGGAGVTTLPLGDFPATSSASSQPSTSDWARTWGIDSSGSWGWNNITSTCDTTIPGNAALQVHYPAHSSSPSCGCSVGGGQFYSFFKNSDQMASLAGAPAVYLQYKVKFPTNFDFGKGAKLPGLFGGTNQGVSGGNHSTDAWSTRLMWRTSQSQQPQGEVYLYDPQQSSGYGADLGLGTWSFQADDQWHSVEQEVQNSAGGSVVTIWYDGVRVFSSSIATAGVPTAGIFFSTFFGGHAADWGPQADEDMYFANFQVSNNYISPNNTTFNNMAITNPTSIASPTASATVTCVIATACASADTVSVAIQPYGFPDNSDGVAGHTNTAAIAYPKSAGYATLHDQATEGSGTYDDPITFAAYTPLTQGDDALFAPGTKIYVPYLEKYFVLEDSCDNCNQNLNGNAYLLHLWLGPSSLSAQDTAASIATCEEQLSRQSTQIVIDPAASSNLPVEQTPLYSDGSCTTKVFATSNPAAIPTPVIHVGVNPSPTPLATSSVTPTATPAGTISTGNDGRSMTVAVTSYGFPDNDDGNGHFGTAVIAFPRSGGNPTLHDIATEGRGSYDDPITFAAAIPDTQGSNAPFPPGARIYIPFLHKYFILEDQCAGCEQGTNGNAYHIDLWMGPNTPTSADTAQSIENCEGSITHASEQIILDPSPDHTVDTTPLYKNGTCSAKQY